MVVSWQKLWSTSTPPVELKKPLPLEGGRQHRLDYVVAKQCLIWDAFKADLTVVFVGSKFSRKTPVPWSDVLLNPSAFC